MATTAVVDLDKVYAPSVSTHGTIQIRVVVLHPKPAADDADDADHEGPSDEEAFEGGSPLSAYLERKAYGQQCVVFVVHGQRHHAWGNGFIERDLGFKYLKTRTMIVVDLDGLTPEALSGIVQGSRQGLYEGDVMGAVRDRMVASLKKDPDLTRLQSEAEQRISELRAGDAVVKKQLDELIDAHSAASSRAQPGVDEAHGSNASAVPSLGKHAKQEVVVRTTPDIGTAGQLPVLIMEPDVGAIRLRPDVERVVRIVSSPPDAWQTLEAIDIRLDPAIPELSIAQVHASASRELTMAFRTPPGFDTDDFPVETTLRVAARFKGHAEVRLLERDITVALKRELPPRPVPVLRAVPTILRVVSRQPVKLLSGGASTHVRMRWDGADSLVTGAPAPWSIQARCLSMGSFPHIGLSLPKDGRFELLLDTPHGMLPEQTLEFEVEASGPSGQRLVATFSGRITDPPQKPQPRKLSANAPASVAQRRPPYELRYVSEAQWHEETCWGQRPWSASDVGSFAEPTESSLLTLIVNDDAAELKAFREQLAKRKLEEKTVEERVTRYTAHVAFHLYQMYRFKKQVEGAPETSEAPRLPTEEDLRLEINRVATTLLRLMEVSR